MRRHHRRRWPPFDPNFLGLRHPFHRVKFQFLLQRRIFLWFGATIVISAIVVGYCVHVFGGDEGWGADGNRARKFLGHRYAEVWNDPEARTKLTQATSRDLGLHVELRDSAGNVLDGSGKMCKHPFNAPVLDESNHALGTVTLCGDFHAFGKSALGPLFVGLFILWAASGIIARRLARPIYQIALVADDIGRGQLSSRVRIPLHHRGEMGLLAEALYDMAVRIEKQLADQRALLATVSHEIRTPLARMRLLIEFARGAACSAGPTSDVSSPPPAPSPSSSPASSSATKSPLEELDREIVAIDALVSDLLAGSRIDFAAIKPVTMDATEVAKEAIERTGVAPEKLVVDVPHLQFRGDPTLVARAVTNLLENADRHAGGVTMFHVHQDGNLVAFDVEDDGPGFAPGEESQAFEPFYKNPRSSAASARSSGLGLALVKRIAEAHGGRAFAENRAQGGARVGVRFRMVGR
ncbi:ATP-binding protein [Pendulispora albinea]|uniref:histidine kinase n=1 Tax=Pendulispora albinea TaxID=2741071 RepID=A0ABZ2LQ65_9BACT